MAYFRLLVNPDVDNALPARDQRPRAGEIGLANAWRSSVPSHTRQIQSVKPAVEWSRLKHLEASLLRALAAFLAHWLDGVRQQCTQGDPIRSGTLYGQRTWTSENWLTRTVPAMT